MMSGHFALVGMFLKEKIVFFGFDEQGLRHQLYSRGIKMFTDTQGASAGNP
jgi:hypothetical protein